MRAIKAKVYFTKTPAGTSYSGGYPASWDSARIPYIAYCDVGNDGKDFHNVLAFVPDDKYDEMIADPQVEAIDNVNAKTLADTHRPQVDKIIDQSKILLILAKQARGETLTVKELGALDADSPELGVSKSKSFDEFCTEYEVSW